MSRCLLRLAPPVRRRRHWWPPTPALYVVAGFPLSAQTALTARRAHTHIARMLYIDPLLMRMHTDTAQHAYSPQSVFLVMIRARPLATGRCHWCQWCGHYLYSFLQSGRLCGLVGLIVYEIC